MPDHTGLFHGASFNLDFPWTAANIPVMIFTSPIDKVNVNFGSKGSARMKTIAFPDCALL
jgi:hypothetical protein